MTGSESSRIKVLIVGGAVALAVGSFLPWVKASVGAFSATKSGTEGDGVITLILAVAIVALFAFLKKPRTAAIWVIVLGALATIISVIDVADVSNKAGELSSSSGVSASVGVGLIIATIASVAIVVGGVLALREAKAIAPPQPPPAP